MRVIDLSILYASPVDVGGNGDAPISSTPAVEVALTATATADVWMGTTVDGGSDGWIEADVSSSAHLLCWDINIGTKSIGCLWKKSTMTSVALNVAASCPLLSSFSTVL
jgi:hypothetical protein